MSRNASLSKLVFTNINNRKYVGAILRAIEGDVRRESPSDLSKRLIRAGQALDDASTVIENYAYLLEDIAGVAEEAICDDMPRQQQRDAEKMIAKADKLGEDIRDLISRCELFATFTHSFDPTYRHNKIHKGKGKASRRKGAKGGR